jgi:hypothetical protein
MTEKKTPPKTPVQNVVYLRKVQSWLLKQPSVKQGKMFGCPGYYVNGKLAVCHYGDFFFVKLPAAEVEALVTRDTLCSREGPMSPKRSMGKEWVFIHVPQLDDLESRKLLFMASIRFVAGLS